MLNLHFAAGKYKAKKMRVNAPGVSSSNLRSITRNRTIGVAGGAILMAVGVWGMIAIGSDTLAAIDRGEYTAEASKEFQMNSYVFLFAIVGGLVMFLYAALPIDKKASGRTWQTRSQ
jgi:hypothetical protein